MPRERWNRQKDEFTTAPMSRRGVRPGTVGSEQVARPEAPSDRLQGLVVQVLGVQWEVLAGGERLRCVLKRTVKDHSGMPVVGDVVEIDPPSGGMSRIMGLVPRRTSLRRPDPHKTLQDQVMVANIDQVLIVASVSSPALNPWLVDRYLVAAWKAGAAPVLCLTKCDLPVDEITAAAVQTFVDIDIPVIRTCAVTGEGIDDLLARLEGHTSAFVGQSGVGKTSLARVLLRDDTLRVGTVNESTGRGRHTTSSARMLPLGDGRPGYLVDLPGQRVFGLSGVGDGDLLSGFPDLAAAGPCQMPLCSHEAEAGCVLREAVASGRVPERRLQAFLRIRTSLETE